MRIVITADPFIPLPPVHYGGIERIVYSLCQGLVKNQHEVILIANINSRTNAQLIPFPEQPSLFNKLALFNSLKKIKPDVIHSFSRLAYLLPLLRTSIPKLMSYQREPTIAQIRKAVFLAKKNTLTFSGCSNYISDQIA